MTEISDFAQKMGGDKKPVDLSWMRAAAAAEAAWGVTEFTLYYQIQDRGDEIHRQYCDFVGRLNAVLRNASLYRPVLLYYPIETFQEEYIPTAEPFSLQTQSAAARRAVESFERLGGWLTQMQIPFTLIDYAFLAKAESKGKEIELAGSRFHMLVLPSVELPKSSADTIDRLRKGGFRILADGKDTIAVPDMPKLEPASPKIVFGQFKREGYDIFVLTNADKENVYEGRLANVAGTAGFILDPQTGGKQPFDVSVRLAPLQTLLYVHR